jgi:hypothetical protein
LLYVLGFRVIVGDQFSLRVLQVRRQAFSMIEFFFLVHPQEPAPQVKAHLAQYLVDPSRGTFVVSKEGS